MSESEWNLSDKIIEENSDIREDEILLKDDVKEFIKRLKGKIRQEADKVLMKHDSMIEEWKFDLPLIEEIDKLAGEKLCK